MADDTHRVRCPTCGFEKETTHKSARSLQKNGCPDCADSRGLGVSAL